MHYFNVEPVQPHIPIKGINTIFASFRHVIFCSSISTLISTYTGWPPKKTEQSIFQDFALINSYLFFTLLDRASFPHDNNTKIIKFGWELYFMSNFLSYGLSFSGFARFPEFRGTINDSFGRPYIDRVLCLVIRACIAHRLTYYIA